MPLHKDPYTIPVVQQHALSKLYVATGGHAWTAQGGWMSSSEHCSWYGVTCSGSTVSDLDLHNNNLDGQLPSEMGVLTGMTTLDARQGNISGSVPTEIGMLVAMSGCFILSSNALTTTIPTEVGRLSVLEGCLRFDTNSMTGTIPTELGLLSAVKEDLELHSNDLVRNKHIEPCGSLVPLTRIRSQVLAPLQSDEYCVCCDPCLTSLCVHFYCNTRVSHRRARSLRSLRS